MDRVPKHFPHIDATTGYNIPKCCCGWIGYAYQAGPIGEQLAREKAMEHAGINYHVKMANLVAQPRYAFEVEN